MPEFAVISGSTVTVIEADDAPKGSVPVEEYLVGLSTDEDLLGIVPDSAEPESDPLALIKGWTAEQIDKEYTKPEMFDLLTAAGVDPLPSRNTRAGELAEMLFGLASLASLATATSV